MIGDIYYYGTPEHLLLELIGTTSVPNIFIFKTLDTNESSFIGKTDWYFSLSNLTFYSKQRKRRSHLPVWF
jgi:hypothetical protein